MRPETLVWIELAPTAAGWLRSGASMAGRKRPEPGGRAGCASYSAELG